MTRPSVESGRRHKLLAFQRFDSFQAAPRMWERRCSAVTIYEPAQLVDSTRDDGDLRSLIFSIARHDFIGILGLKLARYIAEIRGIQEASNLAEDRHPDPLTCSYGRDSDKPRKKDEQDRRCNENVSLRENGN